MSRFVINTKNRRSKINKEIYGHFSEQLGRCIYDGFYVGEESPIPNKNGLRTDVIEALKKIKVPVIRWPGGCYADTYHWRDGIGDKKYRKRKVNSSWGGVPDDNSFGTHEFMDLCIQIGCEPYIVANVGSGTIAEMEEWIEYMTCDTDTSLTQLRKVNGREKPWKLKYLGIGNENYGCGGNMRPEYYADLYRQYKCFVRNYSDNRITSIACGSHFTHFEIIEKVMRLAAFYIDAISLHYGVLTSQSVPPQPPQRDDTTSREKSPVQFLHTGALGFTKSDWYATLYEALRMDGLIKRYLEIMSYYDPNHKVGLVCDEWGTWHDVEPGMPWQSLYQ
ncbi:MAG: alpha-N-arabinofuranosidase, partial [Nitrospira sp.]|nr:alpha-N-arabinofuranosidase [Nitrospira sp.]